MKTHHKIGITIFIWIALVLGSVYFFKHLPEIAYLLRSIDWLNATICTLAVIMFAHFISGDKNEGSDSLT